MTFPSATGPVDRREAGLAVLLLAALLWLVARPYQGIYHDASIYALLAARHVDPAAYARDIFFVFGSQDDFSLFAPLYALLARALGLATAAKVVVLVGGGLWLWACLQLSSRLLGTGWGARLCALYLATASFIYAPNHNTFALLENFATARSLAIPLATLSVVAAFSNRIASAVVFGILATALHPLFGAWALILLVAAWHEARYLATLLLVVFGVVLTAHAWLPVAALRLMDPEWEAVVRASSGDVFLGDWGVLRLGEILFWIGVLFLGGRHAPEPWRRACLVLALLCASAILLAMVCSYFLPVRLVMQTQPWRVMWLAMLFGTAVLCRLAEQAWQAGPRHFLAACVIAAFAWSFENLRSLLPYLALLVLSSCRLRGMWNAMLAWLAAHRSISSAAGAAFAASLLPVYYLSLEIVGNSLFLPWLELPAVVKGLLFGGGAALGLGVLAAALAVPWARRALMLLALVAVAPAMSAWDARGPAHVRLEAAYMADVPDHARARHGIVPGQVVVWPDHPMETWLVLRAANYADGLQAIGLVFSAERAREVQRRLERLSIAAVLAGMEQADVARARAQVRAGILARGGDLRNAHNYGQGIPTPDGVRYLCQDAALDWVVSQIPTVGGTAGSFVDAGTVFPGRYYLYHCGSLRTAVSADNA